MTIADRLTWARAESDEDRLIRLSLAGDREAFGKLTRLHESDLRAFLARRVRESGVDDVLQEVWLAAWSALPSFDRRSRFKTWLYGIAINKFRDHCRRRARLDHELPLSPQEIHAAVDDHARTDSEQFIQQLLAGLSEGQREVIELYYCGDLNLPEVARVLGRNLNTVKYQFYRAHALLADLLRDDEARLRDIASGQGKGKPHANRM